MEEVKEKTAFTLADIEKQVQQSHADIKSIGGHITSLQAALAKAQGTLEFLEHLKANYRFEEGKKDDEAQPSGK